MRVQPKIFQVTKDLGHTKSHEKSANFEGHESTQIVDENKKASVEATQVVKQSEKKEVSENRQVTSTSYSTSESFSYEEELEFEG